MRLLDKNITDSTSVGTQEKGGIPFPSSIIWIGFPGPPMQLTSPRRFCLVVGAACLALAGCGGGGGGGSQTGVNYVTDWSQRDGAAITGVSQRVTLMREDGTTVTQQVLNVGTQARQQVRLNAPTGTYRLRVELNSAANFAGSVTGVAEASATVGGTVETAVGSAVSGLRIEPGQIVVGKGGHLRLAAAATSGDGRYTFVAPGSIAWSVEGTNATVAADGTLTGVAYGPFKVSATHAASSRTTTSNATVAVPGAVRSKWTVLVFLSSANNLYPFALPNINQMERVANDDVRFVIQWKQTQTRYPRSSFDGTRRYLVKHETTDKLGSELIENLGGGIDMGRPETLHDFIDWAKAHYPADRYALIVWSHGNGWMRDTRVVQTRATSYDDEFSSAIKVWELPTALQGHRFDILSFDACLMQMLEVASEVKPYADYIAASAENTPAPGYPYDRVFQPFADNPDAPTRTLAQAFVTGHIGNPSYKNQYVTQSVLDMSRVGALESAVDGLGAALLANRAALTTAIPAIRAGAPKYGDRNDGRYYYDLADIALRLKASPDVPETVKSAAQAVLDAHSEVVVYSDASALDAFSRGLSIDFSASTNAKLMNYANLNLAKTTRWDDWLLVAP
jgi:hypothetical protein